jgi:hypothetical protein
VGVKKAKDFKLKKKWLAQLRSLYFVTPNTGGRHVYTSNKILNISHG